MISLGRPPRDVLRVQAGNVAAGSSTDLDARNNEVRSIPLNGHWPRVRSGPKSAMCGRLRFGKSFLHGFAALVGAAMCSAF